jgi:hypothetical protein
MDTTLGCEERVSKFVVVLAAPSRQLNMSQWYKTLISNYRTPNCYTVCVQKDVFHLENKFFKPICLEPYARHFSWCLLLMQILSGATKLKYVLYTIKHANSLTEIVYRIHLWEDLNTLTLKFEFVHLPFGWYLMLPFT